MAVQETGEVTGTKDKDCKEMLRKRLA